MDVATFLSAVAHEVAAAQAKHPPINSAHEGLAVIWEEFEEFKAEVWKRVSDRDPAAMTAELIQIAAMCARTAADLSLPPTSNDVVMANVQGEIDRLRAALVYYTTATYVSSWGNQDLADDGALARHVLAQPADNADPRLATATQTLLAALAVAQEKAQEQQAAWDASSGEDGDFAAYLAASERYKTAEAEVDQARTAIAQLLLGDGDTL